MLNIGVDVSVQQAELETWGSQVEMGDIGGRRIKLFMQYSQARQALSLTAEHPSLLIFSEWCRWKPAMLAGDRLGMRTRGN